MAITIKKGVLKPEASAASDAAPDAAQMVQADMSAAMTSRPVKSRGDMIASIVFAVLGFIALVLVVILVVQQTSENSYYAAAPSLWPAR